MLAKLTPICEQNINPHLKNSLAYQFVLGIINEKYL